MGGEQRERWLGGRTRSVAGEGGEGERREVVWWGEKGIPGPPPCAQNKNLYETLSRAVFLCFYPCHVYVLCTGLSLLVVIIFTLSLCFFFAAQQQSHKEVRY